ncbi:MAG: helix-turn-helix transcriptional regulator [Stagnimonas sp.]|nr:helix-turn-helix transcriptional regulator [Stagnimonas sp.]
METRQAFGQVLKMARKKKSVSQEELSEISSRTYISSLERGLKNPTLDKIDQIGQQLGVHPLTLIAATFARRDGTSIDDLLKQIRDEYSALHDKTAT